MKFEFKSKIGLVVLLVGIGFWVFSSNLSLALVLVFVGLALIVADLLNWERMDSEKSGEEDFFIREKENKK